MNPRRPAVRWVAVATLAAGLTLGAATTAAAQDATDDGPVDFHHTLALTR